MDFFLNMISFSKCSWYFFNFFRFKTTYLLNRLSYDHLQFITANTHLCFNLFFYVLFIIIINTSIRDDFFFCLFILIYKFQTIFFFLKDFIFFFVSLRIVLFHVSWCTIGILHIFINISTIINLITKCNRGNQH